MQWRWLFGQFFDPDLPLTGEQRARARELADGRLKWRMRTFTVLLVAPPLVGLALIWLVDDWLAARTGLSLNAAHTALIVLVVSLFWPWSAWAYGRLYTRPYRRALREVGVRVCIRCGYPLDTLPSETPCPECGAGAL